jgi:hypothetical protein
VILGGLPRASYFVEVGGDVGGGLVIVALSKPRRNHRDWTLRWLDARYVDTWTWRRIGIPITFSRAGQGFDIYET